MNPWEQDWGSATAETPTGSNPWDRDWSKPQQEQVDKPPAKRSAFAVANDLVIETANAAAGGVGAVAEFVSPGNEFSKGVREFVKGGEASQSDVTKASKAAFAHEMEQAGTIGDEVAAVGRYLKNNPLLAVGQAAGSLAGPGLAVGGARAGAAAAGLGAKAAGRAGLGAGAATGAAMSGGDAAGEAYELVMNISDQTLEKTPQWQELAGQGLQPADIKKQLAESAARDASVIPAMIGAVTGVFGAERLIAGFGKSAGRGVQAAKGAVSEGLQEAAEEGATAYEGRRAAAALDPSIDPTKGVAGAAAMGGALGAGTGGAVGAVASPRRLPTVQEQTQAVFEAEDIDSAIAAATELATANSALDSALEGYLGTPLDAATPAPAITPESVQGLEAAQVPGRPPITEETRQGIDRQAELAGAAAQPGIPSFERENALQQAQVARGAPAPGPAAEFADLTPMNPLQVRQRLTVLRDQVAQQGGNALELQAVAHPSQKGSFAIARRPLPALAINAKPAAPAPAEAQQRIESAALAGSVAARRGTPEEQGRQTQVTRALKSIEERGGVASPAEARIVQQAGLGKPYDRIDEALVERQPGEAEKLTAATGIAVGTAPREEVRTTEQTEARVAEMQQEQQAASAARSRANERGTAAFAADQAQKRVLRGEIAEAGATPAERPAPSATPVIQALATAPAERTDAQRIALRQAKERYSAEDYAALELAATAPFKLTQEQRVRVRELRRGGEKASTRREEARAEYTRWREEQNLPDSVGTFGKWMKARVASSVAATQQLAKNHDWKYNEGDTFLSTKTGKTYKITGRTFQKSVPRGADGKPTGEARMVPVYRYETRDGESGTFLESGLLESKTMKNLVTSKASEKRDGSSDAAPAGLSRVKPEVQGLIQRLARAYGKDVQWIENDERDGYVRSDRPNTVYLNVDSSKPHLIVFGHELLHSLKQTSPKTYAALQKAIEAQLKDGALAEFEKQYGENADLEEIVADIVGNRMTDENFWSGVFSQMDAPAVARLGSAIINAVNKAKKVIGRAAGFSTDELVNDLDAAKAAVQKAMRQFAQERRATAAAREKAPVLKDTVYADDAQSRASARSAPANTADSGFENREFNEDDELASAEKQMKASPRRWFSGAPAGLDELRPQAARDGNLYGPGVYLAQDRNFADTYGRGEDRTIYEVETDFQKPFDTSVIQSRSDAEKQLIELGVPKTALSTALGQRPRVANDTLYQVLAATKGSKRAANEALEKAGFDAILFKSRRGDALAVSLAPVSTTKASTRRSEGDTKYRDRARELAAQEKPPSRSTVNYFNGTVPTPRLPTNFDIARFFTKKNARYMEKWPSAPSRKALVDVLRSETLFALSKDGSAVGWYDRKVKAAYDLLAQLHPEIKTSPESRFAFTALLAITSNSTAVNENFEHAEKLYNQWKETGVWPTKVAMVNKAGNAMEAHLAALGRIVQEHGWKKTSEFLTTEHPVREIEEFTGMAVPSELSTARVYGALAFGSKVGTFFNNLYGNYDSVTMDRWFMRTINRNRGNMLALPDSFVKNLRSYADSLPAGKAKSEAEAYIAAREAGGDTSAEAALRALPALREAAKKQYNAYQRGQEVDGKQKSFYPRTRENVLSKMIVESLELDQQTPMGGADRAELRAAMRDLQKGLRDSGIDIEIADLQAVLWYYEKDLFDLLKGKATKQENLFNLTEGLDGAEDYETAARALLAKRGRNDAGQPGAERAGPGRPGQRRAREERVDTTGDLFKASPRRLPGTPTVDGSTGPDPQIVAVADAYARENGIPLPRQAEYVEVDAAFSKRIADAYEAMPHAPNDKRVREAYAELIKQTRAQYDALEKAGYQFYFFDAENDPYNGNPWNAMRDLRANKRMAVFSTEAGYGDDASRNGADNPMLADTGLEWPSGSPDGAPRRVLANDLFRAVHDAFGHGLEGAGFRARGEENAWQAHVRLFTGPAVGAITTETRGQNSWLNYGPKGESNRTAKLEDTVFADQKAGLMPEWTWTERVAPNKPEAKALVNIGLNVPGGGSITADEAVESLERNGGDVVSRDEHVSDTEPTLVAGLAEPLTAEQAERVSRELKQESIAQKVGDTGELYGPMADQWRPFNPDYFLMPDGTRASATKASTRRFDIAAPTKLDNFIRKMQDKQIDTKRLVQAVRDQIGDLGDQWNPYLQEELYHGRAAKKTKDFLTDELKPLLQMMQAAGVSLKDFETYLHNRHAEERNAQVAKINKDMPDGGSGIKTADARKYLAAIAPAERRKLEALALRVDRMNSGTEALLVNSGLEKQSTIDAWKRAYRHYVPLQRQEFEDDAAQGSGRGFSVKGGSSRRAMGSDQEVTNILANIASARERAITRAEKNRVATSVYGMAIKAKNDDFWKAFAPDRMKNDPEIVQELVNLGMAPPDAQNVMSEPTQRYVDPRTGLVVQRVNPLLRNDPNILAVRVNGEDRFVMFNHRDERANRMVRALKNLDADQLGQIMSGMAKLSRFFASINTQWNPIFGVVNLVRDVQGAIVNLSTTPLADRKTEILKNSGSALLGIYSDIRAVRKGRHPQSQWAKLWEEFQNEGGQTGFRDLFATPKERAEALEDEFKQLSDGKLRSLARLEGPIFGWLSDYNTTMENAVRLSAYKAGLEKGMTKQQAASTAKNLTVNFNRKGEIATQAGALYAFFNASAQGTARLAETLRGPAGKKIIAGGLLLGVVQAFALSAAGFGDEDPPEFVRDRNVVIPLGDGKFATVPMPLGLHVLPAVARRTTEWLMAGGRDSGKRLVGLLDVLADAFNPVGNAGLSMQTLAPTPLDPLAALAENRDFAGRPIAREDFNQLDPTPGLQRAKAGASGTGKAISYWLNLLSGGTDYKPGALSPTPDQVDYFIGQFTGGLGRELLKLQATGTAAITGEDTPPHRIPLLGRFYGDASGQASQAAKFYANVRALNEHKNEIDGRRENGDAGSVAQYIRENPEAVLAMRGVDRTMRQLSVLKKQKARLLEADEVDRERVKAVEERITEVMVRLNSQVEARKAAAGTRDSEN